MRRPPSLQGTATNALALCACLSTLAASSTFAADASPACAAKRANIESHISEAQARGRSQELRGLQRALKANQANCTDASLARERAQQIAKAERELAERQSDLQEAERTGDAKKIASRQAKLDEARRALAYAQQPVTQ